jgi:hypothetical protein
MFYAGNKVKTIRNPTYYIQRLEVLDSSIELLKE